MKNTIRTLGISLILLTASVSSHTVFADSENKIDLNCVLSFSETGTNIFWDKQSKDRVSSYKIYISDPLPQSECFRNDIPVKYVEDISKLDQNSYTFDFKRLENGKYYRFKLEAYNGSELVGSDTCGSLILGEDYHDAGHFRFGIDLADLHTANIVWDDVYDDNVKRTVKFYRIDADGFHDFGSADISAEKYTFNNLESDKRYSVAAEVYEGEKMIFTYQFGFWTTKEDIKTDGNIEALKDYRFYPFIYKESDTQIRVTTSWDNNGASSPLPFKDINYKIELSEPLSSEDYFANKKTSYKSYYFDHNNFSNFKKYDIPFNGQYSFDQYEIYKDHESLKYYSRSSNIEPESSVYHISGLETGKYYLIKFGAYYKGKLIASENSYFINDKIDENRLFFDEEDDCNWTTVRAGSKDGKNVVLTWDNMPKTYDYEYPKGKRTVYFYLSSPYKNKKKIYGSKRGKLSAKYAGKTAYNNLKYTLKGLEPDNHYMVYMEVRCDGKIEDCLEYELSTTVNVPVIDVKQTKTGVELSSKLGVSMHNRGLVYEEEYGIKFDNTCIKPKFVEYYRKEKNGKFKKIGTAAAGKTLTDKNISLGKKYTYKARAYSIIDGKKIYSDYSPDLYNTITLINLKPKLKISYADKNKNIVKITSDKNNGILTFYNDDVSSYSTDGKSRYKTISNELKLKPGKTVYLKLQKKKKAISVNYEAYYYTVTLGTKVSIS